MNENKPLDHAMMSFALMGGLLVTPRPRPEHVPDYAPPAPPKRRWFRS